MNTQKYYAWYTVWDRKTGRLLCSGRPADCAKALGFASKKYHPIDDLDAEAWKALNMRTRYYTTKLHIGAFYLPAFLEEMLREVEEH